MPQDKGSEIDSDAVRLKLAQLRADAEAEPVPAPIRALAEDLQAALAARTSAGPARK